MVRTHHDWAGGKATHGVLSPGPGTGFLEARAKLQLTCRTEFCVCAN